MALTVAVSVSLGAICLRYTRKLHFSIPALGMGAIGSMSTGIICAATGGFQWPETMQDTALLTSMAACSALTQIVIVLSLKYTTAGFTSLIRTSEVVFGFILEMSILRTMPDQLLSS